MSDRSRPARTRTARSGPSTTTSGTSTTVPTATAGGAATPTDDDPAAPPSDTDPDAAADLALPGEGPDGDLAGQPAGAPAGPENNAGTTASDLAARRRAERDTTPATHPPGMPADPSTPGAVMVDRTTVDDYTGGGNPARPVGPQWQGLPTVLQQQPFAPGGQAPQNSKYVIAEFDATSSTVMPGTRTPVTRKEWCRGQMVRRDLYEAVVAEHRARVEAGTADQATPARLPEGFDRLPADAIRPPDVVATGPGAGVVHDPTPAGGVHLSPPTDADRQPPL